MVNPRGPWRVADEKRRPERAATCASSPIWPPLLKDPPSTHPPRAFLAALRGAKFDGRHDVECLNLERSSFERCSVERLTVERSTVRWLAPTPDDRSPAVDRGRRFAVCGLPWLLLNRAQAEPAPRFGRASRRRVRSVSRQPGRNPQHGAGRSQVPLQKLRQLPRADHECDAQLQLPLAEDRKTGLRRAKSAISRSPC